MSCPEPECKERIDERIKEHHGLVTQLNAKIEDLSVKMSGLMPKLDWKGWAGIIFAIACYLIVAGYSVYSQEFKYATKDTVNLNKEILMIENHKLSERIQALEFTIFRIENNISSMQGDMALGFKELKKTVDQDRQDKDRLYEKIDKLVNSMEQMKF